MIYLDPFRDSGKRIGRAGPSWSHLCGTSLQELHLFAARIGLQRRWFQDSVKHPHYDIGSVRIRALALALGAIEVSSERLVQIAASTER